MKPKSLFHAFRNHTASGLFLLIPLVVTLIVLRIALEFIMANVAPVLRTAYPNMPAWLVLVCSATLILLILFLAGLTAGHVIGQKVFDFFEEILLRIPVLRVVYSAARQVVDTLQTTQKRAFKAVVECDLPGIGATTLGFITADLPGDDGRCMVFVPTAPNPLSGFIMIVKRDSLRILDIPVEDAFKVVVSAGILAPKVLRPDAD
jgi:uncharacterized membrane protein